MSVTGLREADRGSVLVETAVLLALLAVPVFYLVATLARVQAGAYAVSAAVREAGRAVATSPEADQVGPRLAGATGAVLRSHDFTDDAARFSLSCAGATCLEPGTRLEVSGELSVEIPLVPAFARDVLPTTIVLTASHLSAVDEFRTGP